MNFLDALGLLNVINEDLESYQEENRTYIEEHKANVSKFYDWLKEKLPELFEGVDTELFNDMIEEHDNSKYSEEEFEPYAQHFFGDKKNNSEFEEAWRHHWMNNKHHPEFWLGEDMPYIYILEMICDWGSFSIKAGDMKELSNFYFTKAKEDKDKNLSDATKEIIEDILSRVDTIIESEE